VSVARYAIAIVGTIVFLVAMVLFIRDLEKHEPRRTEKHEPERTEVEPERRSRAVICHTGRLGVERCALYLCKAVPASELGRTTTLGCEVVKRYPPEPRR
jgi:hypothetical protein